MHGHHHPHRLASWFGDIAHPVIINIKNLLETGQDKTKTLKALMAIKTKDKLMKEWKTNFAGDSETHHFCNSIVLSPWILRSILAKEASSVREIFLAVREAALRNGTLLHKEEETEDPQPPPEEGNTVKSAVVLFKHLFVWGQEAEMLKNIGDVNECAAVPCANQRLTRWRDPKNIWHSYRNIHGKLDL